MLAVLLSIAYAMLTKPIAKVVARRLYRWRTEFQPLGPPPLDEIKSMEEVDLDYKRIQRKLARISLRPAIAGILRCRGIATASDFEDHLLFLLKCGTEEGIAYEILLNPEELTLSLELRAKGAGAIEVASALLERP